MKLPIFIHAEYNVYEKEYRFVPWGQDMSSQESCGSLVATLEVEITLPPRGVLVNGTIAKWREMQKNVRAEAESRVNKIEEQISDLLCIEYKPEE